MRTLVRAGLAGTAVVIACLGAGLTGIGSAEASVRCTVPLPLSDAKRAQVVLVTASGTHATVIACTRNSSGHYVRDLGPFDARIGWGGLAPAGQKREGDRRTPRGNFPLRSGFGQVGNPGTRLTWLTVDSKDVWVDDPDSTLYNLHARLPANGRWTSAERLDIAAYHYAQVIGYNEARTPGRGSAIFMHVSTGGATAGCVSMSQGHLLAILRWERAGAYIGIHA
jgi:L,D-peptidoglycan transpeptidase YkuD (ErfK/YbiS/YcfS/YnhG family)